MAKRRMFSQEITDSDAFLDMPLSAQALYFHLGMNADDDGFVNNPKKVQRGISASNDDMQLLAAKKFVIVFDSGVIVIKHWKVNNSIRSDRRKPTNYEDEMLMLGERENGTYYLVNTPCLPSDNQAATICQPNDRVGKDRLGKVRLGKGDILSGKPDRTDEVHEIVSYLNAVAGTEFRPSSKKTVGLVNARLSDGFTVGDFKAVIDTKASEWINDQKMRRYIRPETLFGTKFEGYLQESKAVKRSDERFEKYA